MEKTISQQERVRRAEEIYYRRRIANGSGVRVSSNSVNNNKNKISLFKKMAFQLAICSVIYIIFYFIKNTNYIFSENVINKTKEFLSYDINFNNVYNQVNSFFQDNKDKFIIPGLIGNEEVSQEVGINEESLENEKTNIDEVENKNEVVDKNNIIEENIIEETNMQSGIGGAETSENNQVSSNETSKKTQMELDAEYAKLKCEFVLPIEGTVTSRYGEREATNIVSAYHYGIDIGANSGTAIYASMAGTISVVSSEGDYR